AGTAAAAVLLSDTEETVSLAPHRSSHLLPPAAAPASDPGGQVSATPYHGLRILRRPLFAGIALVAALGLFLAWRGAFSGQARQCQAVLRRQRGSDGKLVDSTPPFEVPLDDLHLLGTAVSTYMKPLYPGFRARPEAAQLEVRGEDYRRFLRVQRMWEEERPA